jgi:hypothetical protein
LEGGDGNNSGMDEKEAEGIASESVKRDFFFKVSAI